MIWPVIYCCTSFYKNNSLINPQHTCLKIFKLLKYEQILSMFNKFKHINIKQRTCLANICMSNAVFLLNCLLLILNLEWGVAFDFKIFLDFPKECLVKTKKFGRTWPNRRCVKIADWHSKRWSNRHHTMGDREKH